jgi:hypothetical protein
MKQFVKYTCRYNVHCSSRNNHHTVITRYHNTIIFLCSDVSSFSSSVLRRINKGIITNYSYALRSHGNWSSMSLPPLWKFKTKENYVIRLCLVSVFNPVVCALLPPEECNFESRGMKCTPATSFGRNNFFLLASLMITVHIIIFFLFGYGDVNYLTCSKNQMSC